MNTYKIYKEGHYFFKQFENLEDAQQYAQNIGQEYNADLAQEQIATIELTLEEQVMQDISFGKSLVFQFLVDEKATNRTPAESLALQARLQNISMLLEKGAILAAYALLQSVEVDAIFTQESKDKYLQLINNYIQ